MLVCAYQWCISSPLSREETDLVCDNLDAQRREYRAVQCVALESNQDKNNEFSSIRNASIPEVISCYRFSLGGGVSDISLVMKPN
jgi:hypothetical protein